MEHSFIGCLTPSVVNAPNTTKRGLALIPFTPSLKGLVVGAFLLFIASLCHAQWTSEQKTLAGVALVATAIDYGQTRFIAKNTWTQHETNPFMARYPSMGSVNTHFIVLPIATYLILDNISSENRTWALRVISAVEIGFVAHNYSLGIKTSF
jgi:hypothetical protein